VFDTAATEQTARALLFLGLGIGIFTMRDLVSRAFFTMQDTTTPALVGFMTVGINVVLNLLLVGPLEQGGLALATTVASLVGLVTSLLVLNRRSPAPLPLRRLASSVVRTGFAALVMGFVVWAVQGYISTLYVHGTAMELVFLILVVGIGAGVYSGLAWFLRVPCLKMVVEAALQMSRRMRFVSRGSP
jgi:putative peptidoglycan lipid II flippase